MTKYPVFGSENKTKNNLFRLASNVHWNEKVWNCEVRKRRPTDVTVESGDCWLPQFDAVVDMQKSSL